LYDYSVGVVLYFRFIKLLMLIYLVICVCSIPAVLLSLSGRGIESDQALDQIAKVTLGNMGQPQPLCVSIADLDSNATLRCPHGHISQIWAYHAATGHCGCPNLPSFEGSCEAGEQLSSESVLAEDCCKADSSNSSQALLEFLGDVHRGGSSTEKQIWDHYPTTARGCSIMDPNILQVCI
jgi:hypothetical protein